MSVRRMSEQMSERMPKHGSKHTPEHMSKRLTTQPQVLEAVERDTKSRTEVLMRHVKIEKMEGPPSYGGM